MFPTLLYTHRAWFDRLTTNGSPRTDCKEMTETLHEEIKEEGVARHSAGARPQPEASRRGTSIGFLGAAPKPESD